MIGVTMPSTSPRARAQGPQSQRKRPGDLTGVTSQRDVEARDKQQAEELAAAQASASEDRAVKLNTVVDYTQGGHVQEVQEVDVPEEPRPATMKIRVNYPIDDMTFGREVISPGEYDEKGALLTAPVLGGLNTYNFEEGVQYEVPWELGRHLKEKGYVYDF